MSLLQNIIMKNKSIDFDFSKSVNSNIQKVNNLSIDAPIKPKEQAWTEEDGKLVCDFNFHNISHVIYFINQVLEKSKQLNHHPEIFISHVDVRIMLHTADLGQITELDLKFSKFISDVYDDTKFIRDF